MPTTYQPLVFDFARKIDSATGVGAPLHYYDNGAQELFIDNGTLATIILKLENGHWNETSLVPQNGEIVPGTPDVYYGDLVTILHPDLVDISKIRFDHASNGSIYFTIGEKIFRYRYTIDISYITNSWEYSMQSDSPVNQFNAEIQNIAASIFAPDKTLFQPGAKLSIGIRIEGGSSVSFGNIWLDECTYDALGETVSISSRNKSGYFLKDQTLDEDHTYKNMQTDEVLKDLLRKGNVTTWEIEENTDKKTWETKRSSTILDAINDVIGEYDGWAMLEDWENKIYIGSDTWLFTHFPNSNFIFNKTKDVFKRATTRSIDAAYVKLVVQQSGKETTTVTKEVNHFKHWNLGEHKTIYITAPEGVKGTALEAFAEKKAKELQYTGIKDDIVISLHPEVIVGDVGTIINNDDDTEGIQLGLITEIKHSFSKDEGWKTNIIIDSGGEYTAEGVSMINQAAKVYGYNRKQTVMDIVEMVESGGVVHHGSSGSQPTPVTRQWVGVRWIEMTK